MSAARLHNIHKRFGSCLANRGACLELQAGEIHALVGENGAGKSTLMRVLAGLVAPDQGELWLGGEKLTRHDARSAIAGGVGMVHQHFLLVPTLTVAENIILGREPTRGLSLDLAAAERDIAAVAARYGLAVEPGRRVSELSVGEAQRVELLKTLYRGCKLLILDEPTAVLSPLEVQGLWRVLRRLQTEGTAIVLITHKLAEVMEVSERVTVMRAGETLPTVLTAQTTPAALARAMVGSEVLLEAQPLPPPPAGPREEVLRVRDLHVSGRSAKGGVRGVSFTVHAGEVLGIAGVEGNGQAELCEALAGLLPSERGEITLGARNLTRRSPRARAEAGLAHIPADRHRHGIVLDFTIEENLLLGRQRERTRLGLLSRGAIREFAERCLRELDIRPPDRTLPARALSGGNQQKVVVARELSRNYRALLCAQPTRGVDVGATLHIHEALRRARAEGKAILLISAELSELCALADRIAVMFEGRLVGELDRAQTDTAQGLQRLGRLMTGLTDGDEERRANPRPEEP